MSHRRHVHLLLANLKRAAYQLHLLKRDHLFYPTEEEAAAKARAMSILRKVPAFSPSSNGQSRKKKQLVAPSDQLQSIKPPPPVFRVRPSPCPMAHNGEARVDCFTLSGSTIFFADSGGRTAFYDTEARCVITAPSLRSPKRHPIAVSLPGPQEQDDGGDHDDQDDGLYIMDSQLDPCNASPFEAMIYRSKTWHCDALSLPPFFHDHPPGLCVSILSYAVVGGVICVSVEGSGTGTYCFDTASRTWSLAGDWQMPFSGKAEYVPELKLWFGLSTEYPQLPCAADLSSVLRGHEPKRRYVWGDPRLPKEWRPAFDGSPSTRIVGLGSGRFCIINLFEDMNNILTEGQGGPVGQTILVFAGLEVLSAQEGVKGNGVRMIKHKSCTIPGIGFIESVF